MSKPAVTICVPVYNGSRFLAETLRSLCGQTYGELEIVISDNASTDDTGAICEFFAKSDSRIRYIRSAVNIGAFGNVRRLAGMAKGKYFKIANADDVCEPDMVEACVDALESEPGAVLACGLSRLVDGDGRFLRDYPDHMNIRSDDVVERFVRVASHVRLTNSLQGVGRSDVTAPLLQRLGKFDGADMVVLAGIALRGKITQVQRILFNRRMHDRSASSKPRNDEIMQEYLDPVASGEVPAYLTRIHAGYLAEIAATTLPLQLKARLGLKVGRLLVAQRSALGQEWLLAFRHLLRRRRA